jgi:drug/metabolite transporter (DMT)-like permease
MSPTTKAQIQIHFCVLLWGFTAILGKEISLSAMPLVWWRLVIVTAVLACLPRVWRGCRAMSPRLLAAYAGIGVLVAVHWVTFYASIKLSNASVAVTCIALSTVFLAFVEPAIARRPFDARELLLGVAVIPGVALVVGAVPDGMRLGIAVGAFSALLVAVFGSLNKLLVEEGDPLTVTAIELGSGAALLSVLAPLLPHEGPAFPLPGERDAALLVTMAIVCTLLTFSLALVALRHISAFSAQLALNLEPVYTILFATLLLGEHRELSLRFYIGIAVILATVFTYPLLRRRRVVQPQAEALAQA